MSFDEEPPTAEDREATRLLARNAELRRERDTATKALGHVTKERDELAERLAFFQHVADLDPSPPRWTAPKRKPGNHHAIVTAILSDLHLDEVVAPEQVNHVNAYGREIAVLRVRRWAERVILLARNYMAGVTFDGAVVMWGGDIVNGELRTEDLVTNAAPILDTCLFWAEILAAALTMIADEFGKVHVPGVAGNHGRQSAKPVMKGRVKENFDWLLFGMVARILADDSRITFEFPESNKVLVPIYDTRYWLEHGDDGGGGGEGWMGVLGPVMRMAAKRLATNDAVGLGFDHFVCGHWHTLTWLPRGIVNGSMVGLSQYPWLKAMGFEIPQQAMWLTTPERGLTLRVNVDLLDRKREGW